MKSEQESQNNISALEVLRAFFEEMNAWEVKYQPEVRALFDAEAPQDEVDKVENACSNALADIFEKYGVTGKQNTSRVIALGLTWPPTYEVEPDVEEVLEDGKVSAKFKVRKDSGGYYEHYIYSMKKTGEKWTLTKREFLDIDDKWMRCEF